MPWHTDPTSVVGDSRALQQSGDGGPLPQALMPYLHTAMQSCMPHFSHISRRLIDERGIAVSEEQQAALECTGVLGGRGREHGGWADKGRQGG